MVNTKLLISLIIVIALMVSITFTVINFNNNLKRIELQKQREQAYQEANNDILEADRILRESGN